MSFDLPTRESITCHPWIKKLGPRLTHPQLWRWQRHSVALGVAIGIFFGFLIPLAQIPLSAAFSVWLRANIIAAAASTFVTNPFTFPFFYLGAYQVGFFVLNDGVFTSFTNAIFPAEGVSWIDFLFTTGKPVVLGLVLFAIFFGTASYFITSFFWSVRTKVRWARRKRQRSICKTI